MAQFLYAVAMIRAPSLHTPGRRRSRSAKSFGPAILVAVALASCRGATRQRSAPISSDGSAPQASIDRVDVSTKPTPISNAYRRAAAELFKAGLESGGAY